LGNRIAEYWATGKRNIKEADLRIFSREKKLGEISNTLDNSELFPLP
jgi:hypothetical protein